MKLTFKKVFCCGQWSALWICLVSVYSPVISAAETQVSFASDLMPLLKRRCAACHITGNEPGKMALVPGKAYDFLVGVDSVSVAMKRVEAGQPEASYLLHKVQGTHLDVGGSGVRMPFHQGPLSSKDINTFRRWIEQGAPNN